MRDRELEDRLRTALRTEGDALPLTITPVELERRLAVRRRDRTNRVLPAVAGIAAMFVMGLVLITRGLIPGSTGGSASVDPSIVPPSPSESSPAASSETSFRVSADGPASPSATPGRLPELPTPEGTVLSDESSVADHPGEPVGEAEIVVFAPVPPRDSYKVDVVCLGATPIRWSLGMEAPYHSPSDHLLVAGDQACDGRVASHEFMLGVPPGDLPVVVHANAGTAWHLVVSSIGGQPPFLPPALKGWWKEVAGASPIEAFGHCVSSASGADQCGPNWETPPDGPIIEVGVPGENSLGFQLDDDWEIAQARITAVAAGTTAPEYSVGFVDAPSRELRVPIDLDPGSWIVQVSLNADRETERFGAWYNFAVEIAD